mgnify:CR=1 FL=1
MIGYIMTRLLSSYRLFPLDEDTDYEGEIIDGPRLFPLSRRSSTIAASKLIIAPSNGIAPKKKGKVLRVSASMSSRYLQERPDAWNLLSSSPTLRPFVYRNHWEGGSARMRQATGHFQRSQSLVSSVGM